MIRKSQKRRLWTVFCGIALLVYVVGIYVLVGVGVLPGELPALGQRLLALGCATLAVATFALAMHQPETPEELLDQMRRGQHADFGKRLRQSQRKPRTVDLPLIGETSIAILGSLAVFLIVGTWWLTPLAPVAVRAAVIGDLTVPLGEEIAAVQLVVPDGRIAVCQPPLAPHRARRAAALISNDDGAYQVALKAIAEGRHDEARRLLSTAARDGQTEPVQIAVARAQNEMYAGRYQDAVEQYAEAVKLSPNDPLLWCQTAVGYVQSGDYEKAGEMVDRAQTVCQRIGSTDDSPAAFCRHLQAVVTLGQGRSLAEAEKLTHQARQFWTTTLGDDHPLVAASLNNQATVYLLRSNYDGAGRLYQWAGDILAQTAGRNHHPRAATSLINRAALNELLGHFERAGELLAQARTILDELLPEKHPLVAVARCTTGSLRLAQARYDESAASLEAALVLLEETLGGEHPLVAPVAATLARCYAAQSLYAKADLYGRRAEAIVRDRWAASHPFLAACLNDRANVYLRQGGPDSFAQVEALSQQALTLSEEAFGEEHPQTATVLDTRGRLEINRGRPRDARPLLERALRIRETVFGDEHPCLAETLGNLAALEAGPRTFTQGVNRYKKAVSMARRLLGDGHPQTARLMYGLASLYFQNAKYSEAKPLLTDVLAIRRQVLPPFHPDLAAALDACAAVLTKLNPAETPRADALKAEARSIRTKHEEIDRVE